MSGKLLGLRFILYRARWILFPVVGSIFGQCARRKLAAKLDITAPYLPDLVHELEAKSEKLPELFEVEIVDRAEIEANHPKFKEKYLNNGIPVLIRDPFLFKKSENLDFNHLKEHFGNCEINVRRGRYESKELQSTTIGKHVDAVLSGRTNGWYGGNNTMPDKMLDLVGDITFVSDKFPEAKGLWIGAKGSQTQLHRDLMDNMIGVLHGYKRFWLAPPHASAKLKTWEVNETLESAGGNTETFKDRVRFLQVTVGPGEWLYLPCGWFHQVLNTENVWNVSCFTYAIHAMQHWENHRMCYPDRKISNLFGALK